jgi:hypothetical protein
LTGLFLLTGTPEAAPKNRNTVKAAPKEDRMELPLQVDQAGKRSEDLMKLHKDGKTPDEEAPIVDQEPTPKTEDLQKQLTALQAKYDVLGGKYKKEIENADLKDLQRLEGENIALKRQVTQLEGAMKANETLVTEVREELDKGKAAPAVEAPLDVNTILSDEDREHLEAEDLGGKTLEIFLKLARASGGSMGVDELKTISANVDNLSKRTEKTEEVQHQVTIDSEVPEFKEVNDLPEFHAWLEQPVSSFSTRKNRDDLQDALNTGNFKSVKDGIKAFKSETGFTAEPGKKPKKEKTPPIEPDESFINDGTPVTGKIYSLVQIRTFYEDQTKGKWRGRETEAAAIDKDIQIAQQEGRIKP